MVSSEWQNPVADDDVEAVLSEVRVWCVHSVRVLYECVCMCVCVCVCVYVCVCVTLLAVVSETQVICSCVCVREGKHV